MKVSGHREDFWRLLRTALPEYEERRADLAKSLTAPGPSVVVLPAVLRMFAPAHGE